MIRVRVAIDAPVATVWSFVRDIPSQVRWMDDALAIRMTSDRTFECDTRIGPLRTVDRMEIVRERPLRELAVRHVGVVRGVGRFVLRRRRAGGTTFTWVERVRFPWWLGGRIGAWFAAPVLAHVFQRDLHNLKALVESSSSPSNREH